MFEKLLSRYLAAFAAVLLVLTAAACGGEQTNVMSDPSGRITFELPDGWTAAAGSNGTRFSPPGSAAQVQVNTVDDNGRASLTDQRDAWLDFYRENGAEVVLERDWPGDNLPGIEYAHSAENVRGEIIWHHTLLSGDGYVVPTSLQVSHGAYDDLLPVYRDIVASIRPAAEE